MWDTLLATSEQCDLLAIAMLIGLDVFCKYIDECKQAQKEFSKTPGQTEAKKNHRKVGEKDYKRRANAQRK